MSSGPFRAAAPPADPRVAGTVAVILAAGKGTRMRSERAKVLHELRGLPLVTWVVRAVRPLVARTVVVVGHEREAVIAALRDEGVETAVQETQEGTGHALQCAAPLLEGASRLVVLAGDAPLLRSSTLAAMLDEHERRGAAATVLTFVARDPAGYGRIVRGQGGTIRAIVEEREATESERGLAEVNSAHYVFDAQAVLPLLPALPRRSKGERYLTDVIGGLVEQGRVVAAWTTDEHEALGINTPEQLAQAERRLAEG